jgi:hypothetical protein
MSSIQQTLLFVSKQLSLYVGYPILFIGLICNILNIAVFTQLTIFRGKQPSFYLTVESIVDCFQILIIYSVRTFANVFGNDPRNISLIWCKLRATIAQMCAVCSLGTICFAAIDQYLSTSYYANLRKLSTIKLAHRLICILISVTVLYVIPNLIYFNIQPIVGCVSSNIIFATYLSFVHFLILAGLLPISVSSLFATLAYLNVRRITRQQIPIIRRRLDRQLTAMILLRVCLLTSTHVPYVTFQIYQYITPINRNNTLRTAIEQFVGVVIYLIEFLNYTVCHFYIGILNISY